MTENTPQTIRDRVDAMTARELRPEPPRDPAGDERREALEASLTEAWNAAFGVDPLIDKALKDVRQRAAEIKSVLEDVDYSRREARAGRSDAGKVEASIRETLEAEARKSDAVAQTAARALEVGRTRLVTELIPEPPRGAASAEAKADLGLIVSGFESPLDGFRDAVRRAVAADDRVALGLLAGTYGEALFRAKGGSPEAYAGLRAELLANVAEAVTRRSPRSTEARKWKVVLGNAADTYVNGELGRSGFRLKDVPR